MAGVSGRVSGHHHPFYLYIKEFPLAFLPWSIFLIPAFYHVFSQTGKDRGLPEKGRLFAKCWFFTGIIFLSLAATKRALYLLPVFAPIAMLTALYIDDTLAPHPLSKLSKVFYLVFRLDSGRRGYRSDATLFLFQKGLSFAYR